MTRREINDWNLKATIGLIDDELNPAFIFGLTSSELLSQIAKGEINAQELAKRTLENRGLDINGKWVGFKHDIL
jgi:hypothetical protein